MSVSPPRSRAEMPILPPRGLSDALAVLVRGIPFEAGVQDVREHFKVRDAATRACSATRAPRTLRALRVAACAIPSR